jgi:hypothetical protein
MNEVVEIYGFGSFFSERIEFHDIDILIIHRSTHHESCQFAIWCKKMLLSILADAHVSVLSESEEHQISFLTKSSALRLGEVHKLSAENDLQAIVKQIGRFRT